MVEGTAVTDAHKTEIDGLKLKDLKVKNYRFQAIDRSVLETILHKDTQRKFGIRWKRNSKGQLEKRRQQLKALRSEFEIHGMKSREFVSNLFSRTMAIINKMRKFRERIKDVIVVEKIFRLLTPKFNYVVC